MAALDAVELQVHPPYSRDGHHPPEEDLVGDGGEWEVVQHEEVEGGIAEEEW